MIYLICRTCEIVYGLCECVVERIVQRLLSRNDAVDPPPPPSLEVVIRFKVPSRMQLTHGLAQHLTALDANNVCLVGGNPTCTVPAV